MNNLKESLEQLRLVKRKKHHMLIHRIRDEHKLSKRTLLYVKEYGPHSNVPRTIIRESIAVLLFASVLSSFGGLALENIKGVFVPILPLLILLPVLNDMIGDYGIIISSRFSTLLHMGKIGRHWFRNPELKKLLMQVLVAALILASLSSLLALFLAGLSGYSAPRDVMAKVFLVSILDIVLLVAALFVVAVVAGTYFYRKNEDPDNFLIPITTSIADFGNMLLLAALVMVLF